MIIGRCEAYDMVPTEDDARDVRCPRSGVRIRETIDGRPRHRTVCQQHGFDRKHTPPLTIQEAT
jgi:hypothetical protein